MADMNPSAHISIGDFKWAPVDRHRAPQAAPPEPPLGPLVNFAPQGDNLPDDATRVYRGNGFNTIFRPQNFAKSPAQLDGPGTNGNDDNVLELNLTRERLTFSKSLGSVPNRGAKNNNADIFLNGVPYVQRIDDITLGRDKEHAVGIHFEPGVWLAVPATDKPQEIASFVRMASIPHGTTINAQGIAFPTNAGPPLIADVDMTPFVIANGNRVPKFPSQTATNTGTFRIPQTLDNLGITQDMLDNPNKVLTDRLAQQTITSTDTLFVATNPPPRVPPFSAVPPTVPVIGGGTDNIAFLQGDSDPDPTQRPDENADAVGMSAIFWIETVQEQITIPACRQGHRFSVDVGEDDLKVTFYGIVPCDLDKDCTVTVTYTQIQYTQLVILNFTGLGWPHISVANLVPDAPILVDAATIEAAAKSGAPAAQPAQPA